MKEVLIPTPRLTTMARCFALAAVLLASSQHVAGQEEEPAAARPRQQQLVAELLQALNLTPEQKEQIKLIKQQTNTDGRLVQQRLRRARRALDAAIYSPDASEALIEQRTREFADAQNAQARLRASAELKVRRVLTPEQLQTFLQLRQSAIERQRMLRRGAGGGGDNTPPRRLREERLRDNNPRPDPQIAPDDRLAPAVTPRQQRRRALRQSP
ncbi:MAG: Spy/CpxP family protein refolding chaperone [Pyrinomonadaceae bacterium]|nr:Spy/CpxP family protein refolding chaperone [Pyrinomonadaceae bacterium]